MYYSQKQNDQIFYTWKNIESMCLELARQISSDREWQPDYIVGVTRGGLVPATLLSHWLDTRMETLKISFDDNGSISDGSETNLWMAEDAYGYISSEYRTEMDMCSDPANRKNILIIDDINSSGEVFEWIKKDWRSGCMPNDYASWNEVWHNNVRFAVLVDNENNDTTVDYHAISINKYEDDVWINFPWENWWNKRT